MSVDDRHYPLVMVFTDNRIDLIDDALSASVKTVESNMLFFIVNL